MDTEVAVKPQPVWLVEDEEVNHVDAKNEPVLSADVCNKGSRMLKSDIDIEVECLLEDSSECNYSAGEMDAEVTVKQEYVWLVDDEGMSQAHVKDEGIVSAADCDEINEELKTEIDIEENCILGESSEFIQSCKVAGDANVLEIEGVISSTDQLQAVEGDMLECEDQVTVNVEEKQERTISTKKYSPKVLNAFSISAHGHFKCDICGICFKTYSEIVRHINSHKSVLPVKCEVCNKCFSQSGNLKTHMMLHTGEKPFKCKECSKFFTTAGGLKRHMMTHTGEKPFKCKECNMCFIESSKLKNHMRCHTGEKPFRCKECFKGFTVSSGLKYHMRLHTGEKPFKCKECNKCFILSSTLKNHMKLHAALKPFKCKECSKCFSQSAHLKHHIMTHTGNMPITFLSPTINLLVLRTI